MDQKIEADIVAKVLNGDRQAYALLVDEYKSPIYNLAYRMTGSSEDADDLTQEILEATYKCPVQLIAHGDVPHRVLKEH